MGGGGGGGGGDVVEGGVEKVEEGEGCEEDEEGGRHGAG